MKRETDNTLEQILVAISQGAADRALAEDVLLDLLKSYDQAALMSLASTASGIYQKRLEKGGVANG